MQIHVVSNGENLWGISQSYNIPMDQLIEANELTNPEHLVVGQALAIPIQGIFHWVQPGESLWSISRRYNISMNELVQINQIENLAHIPVGLRLYIPPRRVAKDIGAYIHTQISGQQSPQLVRDFGDYLTYLEIFRYTVNRNGDMTSLNDYAIINAAYEKQVAPIMVIANDEDGAFSTTLATTILSNESLQDRLLDQAIATMDEKGYLGLDFDFENVGQENRDRYTQFMRKASAKLKAKGYFLTCALPAKYNKQQQGLLVEGHDYAALGEICDIVFIMTYDWGWIGGPPMPVAPLNEVRHVMEFATSTIPRHKIMMGIPLYGYDWTLPFSSGTSHTEAVLPQRVLEIAKQYHVPIQYDTVAQSPHIDYYDEQGRQHKLWFEDVRSIQAKFDLVKEFDLRGFFYWALGFNLPQNWLLIQENFVVRKRV